MNKYDLYARAYLHHLCVGAFDSLDPVHGHIVRGTGFTAAEFANFRRAVARELERQRRDLIDQAVIRDAPFPSVLQDLVDEQEEAGRVALEHQKAPSLKPPLSIHRPPAKGNGNNSAGTSALPSDLTTRIEDALKPSA